MRLLGRGSPPVAGGPACRRVRRRQVGRRGRPHRIPAVGHRRTRPVATHRRRRATGRPHHRGAHTPTGMRLGGRRASVVPPGLPVRRRRRQTVRRPNAIVEAVRTFEALDAHPAAAISRDRLRANSIRYPPGRSTPAHAGEPAPVDGQKTGNPRTRAGWPDHTRDRGQAPHQLQTTDYQDERPVPRRCRPQTRAVTPEPVDCQRLDPTSPEQCPSCPSAECLRRNRPPAEQAWRPPRPLRHRRRPPRAC